MTNHNISSLSDIERCSATELADWLKQANEAYRTGADAPTDMLYDAALYYLSEIDPSNDVLFSVEPEPDFGVGKVVHSKPMLSLEKVYSTDDVNRFLNRVIKAASEIGIHPETISFKFMAKLDGIAAKHEKGVWATRGDGLVGNDISDSFAKGIKTESVQGDVIGEIVMDKRYAEQAGIADDVARNVVAGILSADHVRGVAQQALSAGAIHFVSFDNAQAIAVQGVEWVDQVADIERTLQANEHYPTDGIVITVQNPELRDYMGENSREPRYAVAKKTQGDAVTVTVTEVIWQVGRTGVLTPVVNYAPTQVGGVINTKATGHNAASLVEKGIGVGAELAVIRSGSVIPFIQDVLSPTTASVPDVCPSCASPTMWATNRDGQRVTINCINKTDCPDQLRERLVHFFKIIDAKNFGGSACEKLVAAGLSTPFDVYRASVETFVAAGFGPKQAQNLRDEISDSLKRPLPDFKLLAAFGVHHLGRGDSKKILVHHHIDTIVDLTVADLEAIEGFAQITSLSITAEIDRRRVELQQMIGLGFNLIHSSQVSHSVRALGPARDWHGKRVVFTGKLSLSRDEMCAEANALGLLAQSSFSKTTEWLVVGDKAGAAKLAKARQLGIRMLSEAEYRALLS